MSEQPEVSKTRKCGHVLEGPVGDRCQECNRVSKLASRKKRKLARNYMECPESLAMWVQNHVPLFPITDTMVQPLYDTIQATRFATGKEKDVSRPSVPAEHVHRLIEKFNKVNLVDKKKVNCRTIVDPFAGGSGILEQAKIFLSQSLKACNLADAFKDFVFVAVDHPNIKKSIKLDMRLDIYEGNANSAVALANCICAPPVTGGELVAFMYFAERCRDYCAFFLPLTWINSTDEIQRVRWGKKCIEGKAYRLRASAGHQWMIVVNSKYKGRNLFANATNIERAGSQKEVTLYAKHMELAKASGHDNA